MEKIDNFNQVLSFLKEGEILASNNKIVKYHQETLTIYDNGSKYRLSIEDFITLYRYEIFYLYEVKGAQIDLEKDLEYYNFKHK